MQCICLLGYCLFPLDIAALLIRVLLKFLPGVCKLGIATLSFIWCSKGNANYYN